MSSKAALRWGSEMWVLNNRVKHRLEGAQRNFLRPLLAFTKLDHQTNVEIREMLQVQNIVDEMHDYQKNLKIHVGRKQRNRLPKLVMNYNPTGKRDRGRHRKRWKDQFSDEN
jgi:hypothetical protein